MMERFKKLLILVGLFFVISVFAQPEIPDLNKTGNFANDFTGTISSSDLQNIEYSLRKFNHETSTQIVLLMIPTLDGYPLEMYSHDVAQKNKIGTKGNDNGLLFIIVKDDKKIRIETGYGLEGVLPDATCSSIIRNEVAPHFRQGDFTGGVVAGLNAIMAATKGEYTAKNNSQRDNGNNGFSWLWLLFLLIFFIFPRIGGRRTVGPGFIYYGGGFGGRSGGSSFGGGGGFGGFSGGGGSFGGGGASGGW